MKDGKYAYNDGIIINNDSVLPSCFTKQHKSWEARVYSDCPLNLCSLRETRGKSHLGTRSCRQKFLESLKRLIAKTLLTIERHANFDAYKTLWTQLFLHMELCQLYEFLSPIFFLDHIFSGIFSNHFFIAFIIGE